jgi:hypothetical protein
LIPGAKLTFCNIDLQIILDCVDIQRYLTIPSIGLLSYKLDFANRPSA